MFQHKAYKWANFIHIVLKYLDTRCYNIGIYLSFMYYKQSKTKYG